MRFWLLSKLYVSLCSSVILLLHTFLYFNGSGLPIPSNSPSRAILFISSFDPLYNLFIFILPIRVLLPCSRSEYYIHFSYAATQNVFKYTQTHREIKVLADTSYCFIVYALAIVNNTLLTSSNVGTTMYTPQS